MIFNYSRGNAEQKQDLKTLFCYGRVAGSLIPQDRPSYRLHVRFDCAIYLKKIINKAWR